MTRTIFLRHWEVYNRGEELEEQIRETRSKLRLDYVKSGLADLTALVSALFAGIQIKNENPLALVGFVTIGIIAKYFDGKILERYQNNISHLTQAQTRLEDLAQTSLYEEAKRLITEIQKTG